MGSKPKFKVKISRLVNAGLITPSEKVESLAEGPWTRDGPYYVSVVKITFKNSKAKEFVLKCPWDFTWELLQDKENINRGSELIKRHVDRMVNLSRRIRELGPYTVKIEKYDSGTLVQENIEGQPLEIALAKLKPEERQRYEAQVKFIISKIEKSLSVKYVGRVYVGADEIEIGRDFIITKDGKVLMVNLNFTST